MMSEAGQTSMFDHPWMSGLFGDAELAAHLGPPAQLRAMLSVECAFSHALGQAGVVPGDIAQRASDAMAQVRIDEADLRDGAGRDGLVVPALVAQLRAGVAEELRGAVHSGLTSQDVIDTALVLNLRPILGLLQTRLVSLSRALERLADLHGAASLMGRTRMQAALPITVRDRIELWMLPLAGHLARLEELQPRLMQLHFGGPVGTRQGFGDKGDAVAAAMAQALQLASAGKPGHAMRAVWAELAGWLSLVSGSLGKMGQDVALMAQQGVDEITLAQGGGSSAMAHKSNPVLAELLVTLARFNAVQLGAMHQALVHEQERSGAAWALEWMILPQMLQATGRALTAGRELVDMIERMDAPGEL